MCVCVCVKIYEACTYDACLSPITCQETSINTCYKANTLAHTHRNTHAHTLTHIRLWGFDIVGCLLEATINQLKSQVYRK